MSKDTLKSLLRIRQAKLDEAQKELAAAYTMEQIASKCVAEATEALDLEMAAAMSLVGGDDAVEAFARWLPHGRKQVVDAHCAQRDAITKLDHVRAVLALARMSIRSVELLIDKRQDEQCAVQRRKDQYIEDEIANLHRVR